MRHWYHQYNVSWWRHQMETFSALLAICEGNSPVPGEFPAQRPVTRSFDVFFDLRLNKRLSKHSWGWWLETPSCPLWRHSKGGMDIVCQFGQVPARVKKNPWNNRLLIVVLNVPNAMICINYSNNTSNACNYTSKDTYIFITARAFSQFGFGENI